MQIVHVVVGLVFVAACVFSYWYVQPPKTPPIDTHDAIDDEIRRERIELHNTSRDYADLQLRNGIESYPKSFVDAMLSAAFRSGAKWQQQRPH